MTIAKDISVFTNGIAYAFNVYDKNTKDLGTLYQYIYNNKISQKDLIKQLGNIYNTLSKYNRGFSALVSKFNNQTAPQIISQVKSACITNDFIKLADAFDEIGEKDLADEIDNHLELIANKDNIEVLKLHDEKISAMASKNIIKMADFSDIIGAYTIAEELDRKIAEVAESIQQPAEGTLSTRFCPDHIGVQTARISERVYQCPIDGKIYNYEMGYTNYKGQKVPGGSVAAQTPKTSDFGGIPMSIYDNRSSVLNRIN